MEVLTIGILFSLETGINPNITNKNVTAVQIQPMAMTH